jgi:serine/threonine protein kinase
MKPQKGRRIGVGTKRHQLFSMFPKGHTYADYQLLTAGFAGNFGEVYKALHVPTKKEVALKFTKLPHDKHWYKRFKDENKYLHQLSPHDHIIKAYSNVTHDGLQAFYSMEYLDQGLESYLGTIPSTEIAKKLALFKQVCEGLKHAHSKKIYHRDLHSANIRMDADMAKLVDFGLGKDGLAITNSSIGMLIWRGAVTTPEAFFYISNTPSNADYLRRDTYALGIILYNIFASSNVPYTLAMLADTQAYFAGLAMSYPDYLNLSETERKAHYTSWLHAVDPNLSDKLDISLTDVDLAKKISDIIKKACDPDYTQRYASVQDIILSIEGL